MVDYAYLGLPGLITLDAIEAFITSLGTTTDKSRLLPTHHQRLVQHMSLTSQAINSFFTTFVFQSTGPLAEYWRSLMRCCYFYYFLTVPYHLAFLRHYITTIYVHALNFSYIIDGIMLLDFIGHFNASYVDERSLEIFDRALIRQHYMQGGFLLDFIAFIPFDVLARIAKLHDSVICWVRLLKLIHCIKLVKYLDKMRRHSSHISTDFHLLLISAIALIHVMSCWWYYLTTNLEKRNYQKVSNYRGFGDYSNGTVSGNNLRGLQLLGMAANLWSFPVASLH